jgi:hypothetical protein
MLTQNIYDIYTFCFVFCSLLISLEARIAVSIAMDYGLDGQGSIPSWARDFCLFHRIQACSVAHPASYPMGTEVSFPGGKVARL